jgi:hypothetical protein
MRRDDEFGEFERKREQWKRFGERNAERVERADDRFLHCESDGRESGVEQHAELDHKRSDERFDHARNFHIELGERFDEREPDGDDDLYADSHQLNRLRDRYSASESGCAGRPIDDHDRCVPGRNAGRCVCRVHNNRDRGLSAVLIFGEQQ